MNFALNDEQTMLRDAVLQYMEKSYDFDQRQSVVKSDAPYAADKWQEFAQLGWLAMLFSSEDEGFDGGAVETMLIMQEMGRFLVVEPFLATVVMSGGCLRRSSNATLRSSLLTGLMEGSVLPALAYSEPQSRYTLEHVATTAASSGDDFVLNGKKIVVLNGGTATHLIVAARTKGDTNDRHGISLFCIPADSAGIDKQSYKTVDGNHAAHIELVDVKVSKDNLVSELDEGFSMLQAVIDDATLAVCSEAVGIMDEMTQQTIAYTKDRQQFGVPLSSFQALQHRMVDMFMTLEQSRSLLLRAIIKTDEQSKEAAEAIAAVKYYIGTAGRKLGEEAVQLHGGMGVTDEMKVAHLFKRLTVIDTLFGNSDYQLNRYARPA